MKFWSRKKKHQGTELRFGEEGRYRKGEGVGVANGYCRDYVK